MAFPSSGGSRKDDLATAWAEIRQAAAHVKNVSTRLRDDAQAGNIDAIRVVQYSEILANSNDRFARYTVVPGLVEYVRAQINDPAIDIVAEYNTMLTQINATKNWIAANFPKDASGYLLYHQLGADGRIVQRTLTPAQTAGLRTQLTALIATID